MTKILFVNACCRPNSRTKALAGALLQKLEGSVEEVSVCSLPLSPLTPEDLKMRETAARTQDYSDAAFSLARQFAQADAVVIAAPYWDLMFPAALKLYLEQITVAGLSFRYGPDGRPQSLCRAKALYYVTTAGGYIGQNDFGFSYIQALAHGFFGIEKLRRFTAEGLDLIGAEPDKLLQAAIDSLSLS